MDGFGITVGPCLHFKIRRVELRRFALGISHFGRQSLSWSVSSLWDCVCRKWDHFINHFYIYLFFKGPRKDFTDSLRPDTEWRSLTTAPKNCKWKVYFTFARCLSFREQTHEFIMAPCPSLLFTCYFKRWIVCAFQGTNWWWNAGGKTHRSGRNLPNWLKPSRTC